MTEVGLRELRQQASELVRRVEQGERITITVSGRAAAVLVPAAPHRWRRRADIGDLFAGPADPGWAADRESVDGEIADPWSR